MLKDIEGISRRIFGFSKNPDIDGEGVEIEYDLKTLDLNWLRNLFNIDPNHREIPARHMVDDEDQDYKLNEAQYEALKPYMIGEPVDFNGYNFFLDSSIETGWDWRDGYPPTIQIKNAINRINPIIENIEQTRERYRQKYPSIPVPQSIVNPTKEQFASPILLDDAEKYWEEFYQFRYDNYPFTEFSAYRIDWDNIKNYKRVSWGRLIVASKHLREFLESTCISKYKEVAIAYGPKEPILLISLEYICDHNIKSFFEDTWGACFIIGAKRNKYGIVTLINECFVEVACGEYLTTPDL